MLALLLWSHWIQESPVPLAHGNSVSHKVAKKLHANASKVKDHPKCAACQYQKQQSQAKPGRLSKAIKEAEGSLSVEQLSPGQCIKLTWWERSGGSTSASSSSVSADSS
jgi:hypothetical protein